MSDKAIQVGDKVELTVDISVLGLITIHAGTTGIVTAVEGPTATVKVDGLLGISIDVDLAVLVVVG